MPINLLTNTSANSTIRSLDQAQKEMNTSLNRISSGLRVMSAKDDVAANAIIVKMSALLEGYKQAIINTGQAQSMLETANGGLSEMTKVLQRMKKLAIQASSSNLSSSDSAKINLEFQQLVLEADRLAKSTTFNSKTLISGQTTTKTNKAAMTGQLLGSGAGAGNGIASLAFDNDVMDAPYNLSYISTGTNVGNLTLKNLKTGFTETITLNDGAITAGTESYRFSASGATISLNNNFNKGAAGNFGNSAAVVNVDVVTAGTGVVTNNAATVNDNIYISSSQGYLGDITGTGQIVGSNFGGGNNLTLTLTATAGNFVATGVDLTTTGVKTVTLQRSVAVAGEPNRIDSLTVKFNVATVFDGNETAFTITLNQLLNTATTQQTTAKVANFSFQVGPSVASTDTISMALSSVTAYELNILGLDLVADPQTASARVSTALEMLSDRQAMVGAVYNRLTAAASNLSVATENFQAARAVLAETDVSSEMSIYVGKQILTQTAISMLAKNNETQNYVLYLLK